METPHHGLLGYKENQLHWGDTNLNELVKKIKTPSYLYSEEILRSNARSFVKSAQQTLGQKTKICYALKANPQPELLKILVEEGCGADVVSGGELKRALMTGFKPEKIVFSGVGKKAWEIELALESNIYSFNIESTEELELIVELAQKHRKKPRIAIRLNPQVIAKTHKYISTGNKIHKFGVIKEELIELAHRADLWEHADLVGLSIHIGSQLTELSATAQAIKNLVQISKEIPQKLQFLDVGGGLGVDYARDQEPKAPLLNEYMEVVKSSLAGSEVETIVFEPGRRLIAGAGIFLTQVIRNKSTQGHDFLIVDGAMNDFARPSLYSAFHEILSGRYDQHTLKKTNIVGPVCETADLFGSNRILPELKSGELVVIADTGAYGFVMVSTYNLREHPSQYLLSNDGQLKELKELF